MARIDLDFSSILKQVKDAQESMKQLVQQMQEASRLSGSLSSGIRTQGKMPEGISGFAGALRNIQQARMDAAGAQVINFPGAPVSNLTPGQQLSSSTLMPQNPISQARNVSSNLNPFGVAQLYNSNLALQNSSADRSNLIGKFGGSSDPGLKFLSDSLKSASEEASKAFKEYGELAKQMYDENGKLIKENSEVQKELAKKMDAANKLQDNANKLQADMAAFMKNGGFNGGGGGPPTLFQRVGGWGGIGIMAAGALGAFGTAASIHGNIATQDVFAGLNANQSIAGANQLAFQQMMGGSVPMSGSDVLRHYGNIVSRDTIGSGSFLGTQGYGNAQNAASNIQANERSASMWSAIGGIASSTVAGAGAGLALAKIPAIAAAASGVGIPLAAIGTAGSMAIGGGLGLARGLYSASNSLFGQSMGGTAGLGMGMIYGDEAKRQRQLYGANYMQQQGGLIRQMQDQELSSIENSKRARGLDIVMSAEASRFAATSMLGARASSGLEFFSSSRGGEYSNLRNQQRADEALVAEQTATRGSLSLAGGLAAGRMHIRRSQADQLRTTEGDSAAATAGYYMADPSDFANFKNTWQSVGGSGNDRTIQQLALMRMGGIGSVEQMSGQMFGLQGATNRGMSIDDFKKAVSEGVASGFTTAPMMQAFMSTMTQLSQTLGVSDVNKVSSDLGFMSSAMSVSGVGGMRSLREGATAMASLANYTSQGSGVVGMLKAVAGTSGGISGASGGNMMSTMNSSELNEARDVAERISKSSDPQAELRRMEAGGQISRKTSLLLRNATQNGMSFGQAAQAIGATSDASSAQLRGAINLSLGNGGYQDARGKLADMMRQVSSGKMTMKQLVTSEAFKNMDARLSNALQADGVDSNAAIPMLYEDAMRSMSDSDREAFSKVGSSASLRNLSLQVNQGASAARSNRFVQAQKSLSARLAADAKLDMSGNFADGDATLQSVAKQLNMKDVGELRRAMGVGEGQQVKASDLTAYLMAQSPKEGSQVSISSFTTQALNQFAAAVRMGTNKDPKALELMNQILPGPK